MQYDKTEKPKVLNLAETNKLDLRKNKLCSWLQLVIFQKFANVYYLWSIN